MYFDGRHTTRISDLSYVCGCHSGVIDVHAAEKSATIAHENTAKARERILDWLVAGEQAEQEGPGSYLSYCARDHEGRDCLILHIGKR